MGFAKFMIYKGIYNNPFKVFMDREQEGVVDFASDGRVIDHFGRFFISTWS
jgi:hypothetical protein